MVALGAVTFLATTLARSSDAETLFAKALAQRNTAPLADINTDQEAARFRKEIVSLTIEVLRAQRVAILPGAAAELDRLFAEASEKVAAEPKESAQLRLLQANEIRLIDRMISLADPRIAEEAGTIALITQQTLARLKKELDTRLEGFCPCWPFCR